MAARPKSQDESIRIALTMSSDMYDELKEVAKQKGLNASSLARLAISEYLKSEKKK